MSIPLRPKYCLMLWITFLMCQCSLLGYSQINPASKYPDRIVLNLTSSPTTSLAVTWRTDASISTGYCEWQPASDTKIRPSDSQSEQAISKTVTYQYENDPKITVNQHTKILSGLIPGTKYIYRVGSGEYWSEWFQVQLPPAGNKKISFLYFGDPQTGLKSEWSRIVRKGWQQNPDCSFILYAGDLINRAGRDVEWEEWFDAGAFIFQMVPQVMTPGNHDYQDLAPARFWNSQFSQPSNGPAGLNGTCFFIDFPLLRLISIDSAAGSELEDENSYPLMAQKAWLDSVLRTNPKMWTVLTTHLPFYSTKDTRDNPQLRKHFQPLLEKYKVDLVLTGHDHSYGRGRVSDNPENKKPSIVYIVSVSGPKLYPAGTKKWMEKSAGNLELFQDISIDEHQLSYKSFTASGNLFDAFTIHRSKNGTKIFKTPTPTDRANRQVPENLFVPTGK